LRRANNILEFNHAETHSRRHPPDRSAIAISGSLLAGHQKSTTMSTSTMDPTALTLKAKDLPVVQVNEPF
jgi:hypothetical protein